MSESREQIHTSLIIQLDNPVQHAQFNGAPLISSVRVVMRDGMAVFQQAGQVTEPAIASDLTPELIAEINAKLARLGYQLVPTEVAE